MKLNYSSPKFVAELICDTKDNVNYNNDPHWYLEYDIFFQKFQTQRSVKTELSRHIHVQWIHEYSYV